jgi:mevalonate kinase
MKEVLTSAPGKVILFGEHGVNRAQPALAVAVDLRARCRVSLRDDDLYTWCSGARRASCDREELRTFKAEIDALRAAQALDAIRAQARDFFAPARYVLAHLLEVADLPGLDVEWRSALPIGSGLGSGAATSTSMILGAATLAGRTLAPAELARLAWQGDVIAHGGVSSSLDSSTCAYGGLIRFTVADGAQPLALHGSLPLVIGDTLVEKSTAEANTRVRRWLEGRPARLHYFRDMGYLVQQAQAALASGDTETLGHLMNLHQLFQEKLGVNWPEAERLIAAAMDAGALGAKMSGSGLGGIVIALAMPGQEAAIAAAMNAAGGRSHSARAGAEGARVDRTPWKRGRPARPGELRFTHKSTGVQGKPDGAAAEGPQVSATAPDGA